MPRTQPAAPQVSHPIQSIVSKSPPPSHSLKTYGCAALFFASLGISIGAGVAIAAGVAAIPLAVPLSAAGSALLFFIGLLFLKVCTKQIPKSQPIQLPTPPALSSEGEANAVMAQGSLITLILEQKLVLNKFSPKVASLVRDKILTSCKGNTHLMRWVSNELKDPAITALCKSFVEKALKEAVSAEAFVEKVAPDAAFAAGWLSKTDPKILLLARAWVIEEVTRVSALGKEPAEEGVIHQIKLLVPENMQQLTLSYFDSLDNHRSEVKAATTALTEQIREVNNLPFPGSNTLKKRPDEQFQIITTYDRLKKKVKDCNTKDIQKDVLTHEKISLLERQQKIRSKKKDLSYNNETYQAKQEKYKTNLKQIQDKIDQIEKSIDYLRNLWPWELEQERSYLKTHKSFAESYKKDRASFEQDKQKKIEAIEARGKQLAEEASIAAKTLLDKCIKEINTNPICSPIPP